MDDISLSVRPEDRTGAPDDQDDDLPKAFRRERSPGAGADDGDRVVVTGIQIGFWRLAVLAVKLVLAAIPALIVLGVVLFALGEVLGFLFPTLVKFKILIYAPRA